METAESQSNSPTGLPLEAARARLGRALRREGAAYALWRAAVAREPRMTAYANAFEQAGDYASRLEARRRIAWLAATEPAVGEAWRAYERMRGERFAAESALAALSRRAA